MLTATVQSFDILCDSFQPVENNNHFRVIPYKSSSKKMSPLAQKPNQRGHMRM